MLSGIRQGASLQNIFVIEMHFDQPAPNLLNPSIRRTKFQKPLSQVIKFKHGLLIADIWNGNTSDQTRINGPISKKIGPKLQRTDEYKRTTLLLKSELKKRTVSKKKKSSTAALGLT
jgi:hypothetical protein